MRKLLLEKIRCLYPRLSEFITIEKTSLENMLKMIKEGTIVDSITLSSVLTYVIKNELTDF